MPASDVRRILMTADAAGGVWTYALELAAALVPRGLATTVATMGPPPTTDQKAAAAQIPGLELAVSSFRLEWMEDPWREVEAAGRWLLDLEAEVRPAVVHLNGYAHAALPWNAPVVVVGHSCMLSWDASIPGAIDRRKLSQYREAVATGLCAADEVVAPTEAMGEALQRHYGPLPPITVVPNGRSPDRFAPAAKEPIVFSAGRVWDRAKNIDRVSSVAPLLPWPVVIAGPAAAPPRNAAIFLGRLSEREMAGWLRRVSLFVLPARYEPFGLLPLEAALAGCALVLGDIASLREVWGSAADFVDPEDAEALRTTIARLIASPELLAERARAARQRALTYTTDRMADGYVAVYNRAGRKGDSTRARRERLGHQCAS